MNLRGNKNTSDVQVKKKIRKPRKNKNKEPLSPKLKILVDQFTNITNSIAFQNELNESDKDKSLNEISMGKDFSASSNKKDNSSNDVSMEKQQSYSDLKLHLTSN